MSPFSYSIDNVTVDDGYWGETGRFDIPAQHSVAGWFEFCLGLRVKIWGPISAGWSFRFKSLLHESRARHGEPWYIPGFGTRGSSIGGSFSISYTLPIHRMNKVTAEDVLKSINDNLQATVSGEEPVDTTGVSQAADTTEIIE